MRRTLIGSVTLMLAVVACSSGISCSPCAPGLQIYVTSLKVGSTGIRTCVDNRCDAIRSVRDAWPAVGIPGDLSGKLVELQVYRGRKLVDRYAASVTLRPPSGKDCDCGESRLLTPGPSGTLVQCWTSDEIGCTSRDR
ncbi:hypothetical protein [Kribbella sp. NPDC023855]|uniref:hypothetical protein n=1 Tax=Kribbella sp. NPDC023855 TaxID=3154698 RepID=UPI0034043B9D